MTLPYRCMFCGARYALYIRMRACVWSHFPLTRKE